MKRLFLSLSLVLIWEGAWAHERTRCEEALAKAGQNLDQIFAKNSVDPELYGTETGLTNDIQAVIQTFDETSAFLGEHKNAPNETRALLQGLNADDFNKHFYVVSSLGVSRWTKGPILPLDEVRFADWLKTQKDLEALDRNVIVEWAHALLNRNLGLPGINIEMSMELRTSLRMAIRAAHNVRSARLRQRLIFLEDGSGRLGFAKMKLPELFRAALEIESIRGIGLDEKSIKEALAFGEKVRNHGTRKMVLPFYLSEKNKVRLTEASIRHLITIALRYSHLRQIVRPSGEKRYSEDQSLLLAVFPELSGLLRADDSQTLWLNRTAYSISNSSRYQFGMGESEKFWWDLANPRWLLPELNAVGLGSVHLNLHVARYYDHRDKQLGPFELLLSVSPFNLKGEHMELTPKDKHNLENILNEAVHRYAHRGSALKIKILESEDGRSYAVSIDGRERSDSLGVLEAFTRFSDLSHTWFEAIYSTEGN